MMGWQGKVAFITGGVSGIGFGIARAFSNVGMRLALSYRNEAYRADAERWFVDQGREVPLFVKLDVTDRARFAEVADEVEAHFGKIHILINNAGVSVFGPTDEASYADFDWIMGVNFGGVLNGQISFIPKLKAHGEGGHIVNVASMAAFCAGPQAGIYTASKFAVRGMTECLRYNLAPYNIGVSLMCPGLTKTNAWDSALKRPEGFADSGFAAPDKAELEQFGTAFELGMDPLVVGEKTLAGMTANAGLILTHPDHAEDIIEIYETTMAALPSEPIPTGRAEIERLRREANRAAADGMKIGISDLT
jgi:NAD(P)-dependent dehydrogenase (short-subunit alcohol dehydrogenase family)